MTRRSRSRSLGPLLEESRGVALAQRQISLEGNIVTYAIRRSAKRRTISMLVDERGLRVGAPLRATDQSIEQVLRRHASWVLRKVAQWQARRPEPRQWTDGETIAFMGRQLALEVLSGREGVKLSGETLQVGTKHGPAHDVRHAVAAWLAGEALPCFEGRVEHYRAALGIERRTHVVLSRARTRWGSCHANGRIHLNWRLIQMPPELIDYVVAHEVAHLVEMNHSQRFWRIVGRIVPDYAARRRALRHEAHAYLIL